MLSAADGAPRVVFFSFEKMLVVARCPLFFGEPSRWIVEVVEKRGVPGHPRIRVLFVILDDTWSPQSAPTRARPPPPAPVPRVTEPRAAVPPRQQIREQPRPAAPPRHALLMARVKQRALKSNSDERNADVEDFDERLPIQAP